MAPRLAGGLLLLFALAWVGCGGPAAGPHTSDGREGGPGGGAAAQPLRLAGVVADEEETPLAGARITAYPGAYVEVDARPEPLATTLSDDEGAYELVLPRGGALFVEATLTGHAPSVETFDAFSGEQERDFGLERMVRQRVTVVDEEGTPIEGARLLLLWDFSDRKPICTHQTDADGSVEIEAVSWWILLVQCDGYADEFTEGVGEEPELTIELSAGGTIDGIVVDHESKPIAGAVLRTSGISRTKARTDGEGRFRVEGWPDYEDELVVSSEGHAEHRRLVRPGESDLRIVLAGTGSLSGEALLPGGAPAAGAAVRTGSGLGTSCDATGAFRLAELPPGEDDLRVYHEASGHRAKVSIAIASGCDTHVTIGLAKPPSSYLRLRVVDMAGRPIAERRCSLRAMPFEAQGFTGRDGIAELSIPAPPGTEVTVQVASHLTRESEGRILRLPTVEAFGADTVVLQLGHAPTFEVVVRSADGGLLPSDVTPQFGAGDEHIEVVERRGDAARFAVDTGCTRTCSFWVTAKGFLDHRRPGATVPPAGAVLEVRMIPEARLQGRILGPDGTALDSPILSTLSISVPADPEGNFVLAGLPAGPLALFAHEWGKSGERIGEFVVQAGETLDIGTHLLPRGRFAEGSVVDGSGRGCGAVLIRTCVPDWGSCYESAATYSRREGAFRLQVPSTATGPVYFVASRPGYGTSVHPVGGAATNRIVIGPAAQAKLHLFCAPDADFQRFDGEICDPATRVGWEPDVEWPAMIAPGHFVFTIPDLPPGPLIMRVRWGGRDYEADVAASLAEVAEATIRLPGAERAVR